MCPDSASTEPSASDEKDSSFEGVKAPPPTFISLIEIHALQVAVFSGRQPNIRTGKIEKNLALAQYNVGILDMLKEKTDGNLTEGEEKVLDQYLHLARMAYLDAAKEEE